MCKQLRRVGDFCPNKNCADYGQVQSETQHNIIKFGKTPQGHQRYRCTTCKRTFVETKGSRISSLVRTKGHKEETIRDWLTEAAEHAEAVTTVLLTDYQVTRGQIDGLWAYVGNKGEKNYPETAETGQFWRSTMIDMDTRLRVARGIAKTETEASVTVFETPKARGHPSTPPPHDLRWLGGIAEALVEVYGQVPEYQGRGRPPERKRPVPGWQYVQMVKQRQNGRVVGTQLRVIYGDPEPTLALWGQSTAYVERTHLTMPPSTAASPAKLSPFPNP